MKETTQRIIQDYLYAKAGEEIITRECKGCGRPVHRRWHKKTSAIMDGQSFFNVHTCKPIACKKCGEVIRIRVSLKGRPYVVDAESGDPHGCVVGGSSFASCAPDLPGADLCTKKNRIIYVGQKVYVGKGVKYAPHNRERWHKLKRSRYAKLST